MSFFKRLVPLRTVPENTEDDAAAFHQEMEVDILARTLWGEARGEGIAGMQAVANVVLNRAAIARKMGGYWWGNDVIGVCQKPYQFSCWNRSDPNYRKLIAVDEKDLYFSSALRLARRALISRLEDITGGATHYHAASIYPGWADDSKLTATIGHHRFYCLVSL